MALLWEKLRRQRNLATFMVSQAQWADEMRAKRQFSPLNVRMVALGSHHTLLLTRNGQVFGFGQNHLGQLGLGEDSEDLIALPRPIHIPNGKRIEKIAAGHNFSCCVDVDGVLWTFGDNSFGALGVGKPNKEKDKSVVDLPFSKSPVKALEFDVSDNFAVDVSCCVMGTHALILNRKEDVYSMGHNVFEPKIVLENTSIKSISSGKDHSLAFGEEDVLTWGDGLEGRAGQGFIKKLTPTPLKIKDRIVSASCGTNHTLALSEKGALWVYGAAKDGKLGTNSTENRGKPILPKFFKDMEVTCIAAGFNHSVAVVNDRGPRYLYVFGGGQHGVLGTGSEDDQWIPERVDLPNGKWPKHIIAGRDCTVVITFDDKVFSWGRGIPAEFYADPLPHFLCQKINPAHFNDERIISISAGPYSSSAVCESGKVYCWGSNTHGAVGHDKHACISTPLPITLPSENGEAVHITDVDVSGSISSPHTLALTKAGSLIVWGSNSFSKLGLESSSAYVPPTQIPSLPEIKCVAAGSNHSMILTTTSDLMVCGSSKAGCVDGKSAFSKVKSKVTQISAGRDSTAIVDSEGQLLVCGGKLGKDEKDLGFAVVEMTHIGAGVKVKSVSVGPSHLLAVCDSDSENGILVAIGSQMYAGIDVEVPTVVETLRGIPIVKAVAGNDHNAAISDVGDLYLWGKSGAHLGSLDIHDVTIPQKLDSVDGKVIDVALGVEHTLILMESGLIFSMGNDWCGQLGIGSPLRWLKPRMWTDLHFKEMLTLELAKEQMTSEEQSAKKKTLAVLEKLRLSKPHPTTSHNKTVTYSDGMKHDANSDISDVRSAGVPSKGLKSVSMGELESPATSKEVKIPVVKTAKSLSELDLEFNFAALMQRNHLKSLQDFMQLHKEFANHYDKLGRTPLMICATRDMAEFARVLLYDYHVPVSKPRDPTRNFSAAHFAASVGSVGVMKVILDSIKDRNEDEENFDSVVDVLSSRDVNGRTPLHVASVCDQAEFCAYIKSLKKTKWTRTTQDDNDEHN